MSKFKFWHSVSEEPMLGLGIIVCNKDLTSGRHPTLEAGVSNLPASTEHFRTISLNCHCLRDGPTKSTCSKIQTSMMR